MHFTNEILNLSESAQLVHKSKYTGNNSSLYSFALFVILVIMMACVKILIQ